VQNRRNGDAKCHYHGAGDFLESRRFYSVALTFVQHAVGTASRISTARRAMLMQAAAFD